MTTRRRKLYQVRYWPGVGYSRAVGHKARLLQYHRARAVVRRLRRSGVEAFTVHQYVYVQA